MFIPSFWSVLYTALNRNKPLIHVYSYCSAWILWICFDFCVSILRTFALSPEVFVGTKPNPLWPWKRQIPSYNFLFALACRQYISGKLCFSYMLEICSQAVLLMALRRSRHGRRKQDGRREMNQFTFWNLQLQPYLSSYGDGTSPGRPAFDSLLVVSGVGRHVAKIAPVHQKNCPS